MHLKDNVSVELKKESNHQKKIETKKTKDYHFENPIKKRRRRKNIKKVTRCEHVNEPYYSKGLCTNCYHRFGRVKKSTDCEHKDRKMYARKVCKGCYLKIYHRSKQQSEELTLAR